MPEETTVTTPAPVTGTPASAPVQNGGSGSPQTLSLESDPNTIPEPLRGAHKSMQADYTRKTQSLAEERREFEAERQRYLAEVQESWKPAGVVQPAAPRTESPPTFANESGEIDPNALSQFIREQAKKEALELTKPDRLEKADKEIGTLRDSYGELFDRHITKITDKIRVTRSSDGRSTMSIAEAFNAVVPPKELEHHYRTKFLAELEAKKGLPSVKPGPVGEARPSNDRPSLKESFERAQRKHGLLS